MRDKIVKWEILRKESEWPTMFFETESGRFYIKKLGAVRDDCYIELTDFPEAESKVTQKELKDAEWAARVCDERARRYDIDGDELRAIEVRTTAKDIRRRMYD
jgi:hypothetical protein